MNKSAISLDSARDFPHRSFADAKPTFEYNCDLRRLLPWPGVVSTKRPVSEFGVIWVTVPKGTEVAEHSHDEEEAFIFVRGQGEVIIDGIGKPVCAGEIVYADRKRTHSIRAGVDEDLEFIDIYWGLGEGNQNYG